MPSTIDLKLNAQIKKAAQDFVKFQKEASKSLNKVNKSLQSIKIQGTVIALNQGIELVSRFGRAIEAAINPFKEFERGLVNIGKTTGLAGRQLQEVGDAFRQLAVEIPVSVEELNDIGTIAGQLGINGVKNITKFTEVVAKLTKTTVLGAEEAANQLAKLFNITGESIQDLDKFSDVLVDLGNNFAADERQILALSSEIARSSSEFNLLGKDIAATAVALKALNQRTEGAGTAIGRTFREIETAIVSGGASFRELIRLTGLAGDELRQTFAEDAFKVFNLFINGLSKTTGETGKLRESLAKFNLQGQRVLKVIPALVKSNVAFREAQIRANLQAEKGGATQQEFARILQTVDSRITILRNTINELAISFGESLNPEIKTTIRFLTSLAKKAGQALRSSGQQSEEIQDANNFIAEQTARLRELEKQRDSFLRKGVDPLISGRDIEKQIEQTATLIGIEKKRVRQLQQAGKVAKDAAEKLKELRDVKLAEQLDLDKLKKDFNELGRLAVSLEGKTIKGIQKQLQERLGVINKAVEKDIKGSEEAAKIRIAIEKDAADRIAAIRGKIAADPVSGLDQEIGLQFEVDRKAIEASGLSDVITRGVGAIGKALKGAQGAIELGTSLVSEVANQLLPGIGAVVGQIFGVLAQGPDQVRAFVRAFVDAIPIIIQNLIDSLPVLIEELAKAAPRIALAIANQAPVIATKFAIAFIKQLPSIAKEFVKSLVKELKDSIGQVFEGIGGLGGAFGGGGGGGGGLLGGIIGGGGGGITGAIGGAFGFAKGGIVPPGFPRDSFPAGLTSGERVLTPKGANDLERLLTRLANEDSARSVEDNRPLNINLQIGEQELARLNLNLDRRGFRTA